MCSTRHTQAPWKIWESIGRRSGPITRYPETARITVKTNLAFPS